MATIRDQGTAVFTDGGTITPGVPTHVAGDLLLLFLGSSANDSTTPTHSPPGGWTLVGSAANSSGTTRARCSVYGKVTAGSESDPSVTVTPTGASACHHSAVIISIDTPGTESPPWEGVSTNEAAGASSIQLSPTLTGSARNTFLVAHHADDVAVGVSEDTATFTNILATDDATGIDGFLAIFWLEDNDSDLTPTVSFTTGGTGVGVAGVAFNIPPLEFFADLDSTLAAPSSSMGGAVGVAASLASTLSAPTSSMSGAIGVAAALASTLEAPSSECVAFSGVGPALTLNGVAVPLAIGSWERAESLALGERVRGTSGRLESAVRRLKAVRRGRTTPLSAAAALAYRGLLEGTGQFWSFDSNLYSARGLGPASGSGTLFADGRHGTSALALAGDLLYSLGWTPDEWTALAWVNDPSVGTWRHHVWGSDGQSFRDGTAVSEDQLAGVAANSFFLTPAVYATDLDSWAPSTSYAVDARVSGGGRCWQQVTGTAGTPDGPDWAADGIGPGDSVFDPYDGSEWVNIDTGYEDVVFLPYLVPATWAPMLYAEAAARAWTAQPFVRLDGDLVTPAMNVLGRVTGSQPVAHMLSGELELGAEVLEFELTEAT